MMKIRHNVKRHHICQEEFLFEPVSHVVQAGLEVTI
uniref:Guanine nucleotide binding protein nucleolar 3 like n=1 Tax=Mus musculus TaxID=10090 RepID=S4R289_MOUSE